MSKLSVSALSGSYAAVGALNVNAAAVQAAFENTLSRDGTSPNAMAATLDMNSHRIINLVDAATGQEPVTLAQLIAASSPTTFDASIATLIQRGVDAVTRTVQDKARETLSLKDFGAVGDNIVDDTEAIQDCFEEAVLHGKAVYVPAGGYKYTGQLVFPAGLRVYGENRYRSIFYITYDGWAVLYKGQFGAVQDVGFQVTKSGVLFCTDTSNSTNNHLTSCWISGPNRQASRPVRNSLTKSYGVGFQRMNGALSCFYNTARDNDVSNFDTCFVTDAPSSDPTHGGNGNQMLNNMCGYYWTAYEIASIENTIRGGFLYQADGTDISNLTYTLDCYNGATLNEFDLPLGEPASSFGRPYLCDAGTVNSGVAKTWNFPLPGVDNGYNFDVNYRSFTGLTGGHFYAVALSGAFTSTYTPLQMMVTWAAQNTSTNAVGSGTIFCEAHREGALPIRVSVCRGTPIATVGSGSTVEFVGMKVVGTNIPQLIFKVNGAGAATRLDVRIQTYLGVGMSATLNPTISDEGVATTATTPWPLIGSVIYDPASIASGASLSTTIAVTGALVGDKVAVGFSLSLAGLLLTAYVSAADTVTVVFANLTGGAVDLGSGTLAVEIIR